MSKSMIACTLDNKNGNGSIKQHIFKERYEKKDWYSTDMVKGNISLCGNVSGRNEKYKPLPVSKLYKEEINETCCKKCLKIHQNLRKQ